MQPIVDFLAAGDRSQWRYLTFGLGDQLAYLSRLTKATTIDGSYHTARSLPELRVSGLGQIDTAFWLVDGFSRLDPVLQKSGQRGVRWGFVNRRDYIPILERNGWVAIGTLVGANPGQGETGIQVWENPRAVLPPAVKPPVESPLASFSWGVFPISALLIALSLGALRLWPLAAQQALLKIHFILVGLLPLGLCFWYFRTLLVFEHLKVYFTYDDALFFLSDALALAAFLCWALANSFGPASGPCRKTLDLSSVRSSLISLFSSPTPWFFGICLLATLSSLWSLDWRVSLYFSLHLWLAFGLFLSIQNRPDVWRAFALGSAAALFVQAVLGFWQFVTQNTAFLSVFGLNWPGNLRPGDQAASVVQLVNGTRWLRVYGSLPHPNILGGLVFVFLAGLAAFYLLNRNYHPIILFLIGIGLALLVLTFSRSAWLALLAFTLILAAHYRSFERRRLLMLGLLMLVSLGLVFVPLRQLVFTRSGATPAVSTEDFSSKARLWLMQESLQFIQERPLGGYGAGAFILELAQRASYGYIVEPVHNLALLVTAELGLPGGLLFLGLAASVCLASLRARRPEQILFAALVLGLGVIMLFDHYLWTLAPGRVLLALALGLSAGHQEG
jgi:O-antigen ligase